VAADAGVVAAALARSWQHLARALPGAWVLRDGGAVDRVRATGLPHCLQLRPGASPALAGLAAARAMSADAEIPLMVMEDPAAVIGARPLAGLVLRQLSPEQVILHARVAAAGFEAPQEPFAQLMTADVLRLPGVRCYLGEVGGQAVATGLGVTLGEFTGVFSVATPPAHRRRGYGAAVTARVVADGRAAGATWAWLQSSPPGYATYARLGFQAVETWKCWIAAG
jgi:N-acetylglutamate synthase